MFWDSVIIVIGFSGLIFGADILVRGGAGIARFFGVNPLIVGLTIVAYGTSMPEFMTSFIAMWNDAPGIALGNVLGSNIFNIAIVLGVSAVITHLEIEADVSRVQIPLLIGITCLVFFFGLTGNTISRWEGTILFAGIICYTLFSFLKARANLEPVDLDPNDLWARNIPLSVAGVIAGSILLFLGGKWVIDGSIAIAKTFDIPNHIIGCTIVAVGTSLPELLTSLVSILRKETAMGIGNAIGSCIFNLLMVIGGSAMVKPISSDWKAFLTEITFAFLTIFLIGYFSFKKRIMSKGNGIILLLTYVIFTVLLIVF